MLSLKAYICAIIHECTCACRVYIIYIHVYTGNTLYTPHPYSPKKAKAYKQIICGLTDVELKSFVWKFCPIDFFGNDISHRNDFEYGSKKAIELTQEITDLYSTWVWIRVQKVLLPRLLEYEYDLEHGVRFGVWVRTRESFITWGPSL